jgi:hypothetical protein
VAGNCLAYVDVVLSNKKRGVVGMTPESAVTVHSSTEKTSYPIGGMKITDFQTTDLAIYRNPKLGASDANHIILTESIVGKAHDYSFEFSKDDGVVKEQFQWMKSRSNEVRRVFCFPTLSPISKRQHRLKCSLLDPF